MVEEMSKASQSGRRFVRRVGRNYRRPMNAQRRSACRLSGERVHISKNVAETLERMRFINAVIKSDEEVLEDDELMTEYRTMLAEMVETFLPVVKQLVKAGLLTVNINIEDIDDLQQYSTLTGEPTIVFDNGNIWIDTEHAGGNLRKAAEICNQPPSGTSGGISSTPTSQTVCK